MIKMRRFYVTTRGGEVRRSEWDPMRFYVGDMDGKSLEEAFADIRGIIGRLVPPDYVSGIKLEADYDDHGFKAYWERPETEEDLHLDAEDARRQAEARYASEREHYERLKAKFEGKP